MEETIATLIFKKKHFHDEKHFRSYLYKIARNKSIDYLRRRGRELPIEEQVYNLFVRAKTDLKQRLVKEGITHEDL